MIAIFGTIILLPLALISLVVGFVRFAAKLFGAAADAMHTHLPGTG